MDPRLYQALKNGDVATLGRLLQLQESSIVLDSVTAERNNILHIIARQGYWQFVVEFANRLPGLLFAANSTGDTPLHCAAHAGQTIAVAFLICSMKAFDAQFQLSTMQNVHGNTPLHEAVRNCHLDAASELMKADAKLGEVLNDFGESAIYLATERGAVDMVKLLLRFPHCYVAGPNRRTALHAAVCRNYGNTDRSLYFHQGGKLLGTLH